MSEYHHGCAREDHDDGSEIGDDAYVMLGLMNVSSAKFLTNQRVCSLVEALTDLIKLSGDVHEHDHGSLRAHSNEAADDELRLESPPVNTDQNHGGYADLKKIEQAIDFEDARVNELLLMPGADVKWLIVDTYKTVATFVAAILSIGLLEFDDAVGNRMLHDEQEHVCDNACHSSALNTHLEVHDEVITA